MFCRLSVDIYRAVAYAYIFSRLGKCFMVVSVFLLPVQLAQLHIHNASGSKCMCLALSYIKHCLSLLYMGFVWACMFDVGIHTRTHLYAHCFHKS